MSEQLPEMAGERKESAPVRRRWLRPLAIHAALVGLALVAGFALHVIWTGIAAVAMPVITFARETLNEPLVYVPGFDSAIQVTEKATTASDGTPETCVSVYCGARPRVCYFAQDPDGDATPDAVRVDMFWPDARRKGGEDLEFSLHDIPPDRDGSAPGTAVTLDNWRDANQAWLYCDKNRDGQFEFRRLMTDGKSQGMQLLFERQWVPVEKEGEGEGATFKEVGGTRRFRKTGETWEMVAAPSEAPPK